MGLLDTSVARFISDKWSQSGYIVYLAYDKARGETGPTGGPGSVSVACGSTSPFGTCPAWLDLQEQAQCCPPV